MGQDLDLLLGKLTARCKRQRQGTKRPRYDNRTKSLARGLAARGAKTAALARAAGVTPNAIRSWLKDPCTTTPPRQRPVKILAVEGSGGGAERGRMIMMIRVADFDVAVYNREGGLS